MLGKIDKKKSFGNLPLLLRYAAVGEAGPGGELTFCKTPRRKRA